MSINFRNTNILRPDLWTVGSGSFTGFNQNGSTDENERVIGTNPFGGSSVVWETRPNGTNADDGGWNTAAYSIDNTKLYRYSVWVKRTSSTALGTFYFGIAGTVVEFSDGANQSNPYWDCRVISYFTQNQWYLIIGHVFPYNYPYNLRHPNTGIWTIGGRIADVGCNIGADCKFMSVATTSAHRTYHYYCADATSRLQFYDPRVEMCDGSESTITELLNNTTKILSSGTISTEGASVKHQRVVASGGDIITTNGEWRIHRFNGSGSFVITSLANTTLDIDYLIVGGGGGGGSDMGGGGGGGGVITGFTSLSTGTYSISVGGGGAGGPAGQGQVAGTNGANSTFIGLTAYGGGGGASNHDGSTHPAGSGGSGGGASGGAQPPSGGSTGVGGYGGGAAGTGTAGQGYNGSFGVWAWYPGGGGGAGGAGSTNPALGGIGKYSNILGKPYYWGGGGGGAGYSGYGGAGGDGGGGGGSPDNTATNVAKGGRNSIEWGRPGVNGCIVCWANVIGGDGGLNTGGGGGGGSHYNATNTGGNGGSGIVIVRYKYK